MSDRSFRFGQEHMLRCINHLEKHDAGELRVDGELVGYEVRGGKLHELNDRAICDERAQIGMVFQRFNLFQNLNVLENITVGQIKVRASSEERPSEGPRTPGARRTRRERRRTTRPSSPAASNSESRSPERSPWTRS